VAQGVNVGSTSIISITAIPLIVIAVVLIRDLMGKSAEPTFIQKIGAVESNIGASRYNRLNFLSRQIDVTLDSSASYFDDVVRARLRELIITKASLQRGMDIVDVRRILSNSVKGPIFLRNEKFYRLLYSAPPSKPKDRIDMVKETVRLIENWEV
jgi:hypothetical protein